MRYYYYFLTKEKREKERKEKEKKRRRRRRRKAFSVHVLSRVNNEIFAFCRLHGAISGQTQEAEYHTIILISPEKKK